MVRRHEGTCRTKRSCPKDAVHFGRARGTVRERKRFGKHELGRRSRSRPLTTTGTLRKGARICERERSKARKGSRKAFGHVKATVTLEARLTRGGYGRGTGKVADSRLICAHIGDLVAKHSARLLRVGDAKL